MPQQVSLHTMTKSSNKTKKAITHKADGFFDNNKQHVIPTNPVCIFYLQNTK